MHLIIKQSHGFKSYRYMQLMFIRRKLNVFMTNIVKMTPKPVATKLLKFTIQYQIKFNIIIQILDEKIRPIVIPSKKHFFVFTVEKLTRRYLPPALNNTRMSLCNACNFACCKEENLLYFTVKVFIKSYNIIVKNENNSHVLYFEG